VDAIMSLLRRLTSGRGSDARRTAGRETTGTKAPPRDFTVERETSRVGNLSAEDQAWEAASRKRNRDTQERVQTPPGDG
jgi:hypothetical protein